MTSLRSPRTGIEWCVWALAALLLANAVLLVSFILILVTSGDLLQFNIVGVSLWATVAFWILLWTASIGMAVFRQWGFVAFYIAGVCNMIGCHFSIIPFGYRAAFLFLEPIKAVVVVPWILNPALIGVGGILHLLLVRTTRRAT